MLYSTMKVLIEKAGGGLILGIASNRWILGIRVLLLFFYPSAAVLLQSTFTQKNINAHMRLFFSFGNNEIQMPVWCVQLLI